jgi:hypothetical protein
MRNTCPDSAWTYLPHHPFDPVYIGLFVDTVPAEPR